MYFCTMINRPITCTLLIDDDKFTSFYNEKIVNKHQHFGTVVSVTNGKAALEYLQSAIEGEALKPDIIFLDINMPAMNGWEFIEAYNNMFAPKFTANIKLVILTTSSSPDDFEKSKQYSIVNSYINKPLSLPVLDDVLNAINNSYSSIH